MPEDNVLDQFSKDFVPEEKSDEHFFDAPKQTVVTPEEEEDKEEGHKNRRHRRLEAENQRLREEAIALGARIQGISEAQKFAQGVKDAPVDDSLLTLYGDHDVGRKAAQITQSLLDKAVARAKQETLEEFQKTRQYEEAEVERELETVDSEIESIEDRFNVNLSGDTEQSKKLRNGFLSFVEKLSHKDEQGNIDQYADFGAVWEEYSNRMNTVSTSRNKELASRGMVRSGSTTVKTQDLAGEKWLRDKGII